MEQAAVAGLPSAEKTTEALAKATRRSSEVFLSAHVRTRPSQIWESLEAPAHCSEQASVKQNILNTTSIRTFVF